MSETVIPKPAQAKFAFKPPTPTLAAAPAPIIKRNVSFGKIDTKSGHRIVIYGTGGIGKTTLACSLPGKSAFYDLDDSLGKLSPSLVEMSLIDNIVPVDGISTWGDMLDTLRGDGWDGIQNIVIDSGTKAEELALAHMVANVPGDKGTKIASIEDYGFGKGYQHLFETFLTLLPVLDMHCRAGRNVIIICHDCTTTVPNPGGEDWIRYEPRLSDPPKGKSSIRSRVKEWADHLLFVWYDINVDKKRKASGGGSRTCWTSEQPHCMAKSRSTQDPIVLNGSTNIWDIVIK